MHRELSKSGLVVITVSLDQLSQEGVKDEVHAFLRKQGADCTNLLLDEEPDFWQEKLRFVLAPCYYVFDRQGKWTKFNDDIDYAEMDRLVETLVKGK